jgi:hypothetical protein
MDGFDEAVSDRDGNESWTRHTLVRNASQFRHPVPDVGAIGAGCLALTLRIKDTDWE